MKQAPTFMFFSLPQLKNRAQFYINHRVSKAQCRAVINAIKDHPNTTQHKYSFNNTEYILHDSNNEIVLILGVMYFTDYCTSIPALIERVKADSTPSAIDKLLNFLSSESLNIEAIA